MRDICHSLLRPVGKRVSVAIRARKRELLIGDLVVAFGDSEDSLWLAKVTEICSQRFKLSWAEGTSKNRWRLSGYYDDYGWSSAGPVDISFAHWGFSLTKQSRLPKIALDAIGQHVLWPAPLSHERVLEMLHKGCGGTVEKRKRVLVDDDSD